MAHLLTPRRSSDSNFKQCRLVKYFFGHIEKLSQQSTGGYLVEDGQIVGVLGLFSTSSMSCSLPEVIESVVIDLAF